MKLPPVLNYEPQEVTIQLDEDHREFLIDDENISVSIHPDYLDEMIDGSFCESLDSAEEFSLFFKLQSKKPGFAEGLEFKTALTI